MSDIQHGLTPGRKIKAGLWASLLISGFATLTTLIKAPTDVTNQGMWIIGLIWGGIILGQSGIDTIAKYAETKKKE